jgi:hypothetical protein
VRDSSGRLATPRQVRGGIPAHLDEIAADLLDPNVEPPAAGTLAAEFARLATEGAEEHDYDDDLESGPMGFGSGEGVRRRAGGKLALGVAVLTVIAIVGAIVGAKVLGGSSRPDQSATGLPDPVGSSSPAVGSGKPIPLRPDQIRIVDAPPGDRTEINGAEKAIDNDPSTAWNTQSYSKPNFGGIKAGMGLLINLGTATKVGVVKVTVGQQGATMSLRVGTSDPGSSADGDKSVIASYTMVGSEIADHPGTNFVFALPAAQQTQQYLLVWITKLPLDTAKNKYTISVNDISLLSP